MFLTESEEWAEDHGEHVGYCRTHQQRVLDSCGACNEATTFECNECPTGKDAEVKIESNS